MRPPVLIILGPTATGKSSLAIELAGELKGEVISADSMQVYKGMNIGTAKTAKGEEGGIPHHLISIKCPDEPWTVSDFIKEANFLIEKIHAKGKLPIIVGGTGLYLNAFLEGFSLPITPPNMRLREELEKEAADKGSKHLWEKLESLDPSAATKISHNDLKRIIRALEVCEGTGKPASSLQKSSPITRIYNVIMIGLNMDRDKLYKRINERVDEMINSGLLEEVRSLMKNGYNKKHASMQALGYKEMIDHLEGKKPFKETVDLIKQRTRNFARRQMTWFRRFKGVQWFEGGKVVDIGPILGFAKKSL